MLSGLLGSAVTPAVTAWLLSATGSSSSIAWYVLGAASLSLLALLLLAETRFGSIDEPGVESRSAARPIGAVA